MSDTPALAGAVPAIEDRAPETGTPLQALQRALRLALRAGTVAAFVAPLLARLWTGHLFYESGAGKLANPEGVVRFFTELGIPAPAAQAAFVSRLEYYGGMAVTLGLGTRASSALLAGTMVVALLTADREAFLEKWSAGDYTGLSEVTPFTPLLLLLWLVFYGPGWLSLDAPIKLWAVRKGLLPGPEAPGLR